jgi:hypothetical protein
VHGSVQAAALPLVRFENVLIDSAAFLAIQVWQIGAWQLVQERVDCQPHGCSCRLLLLPIQHKLFLLQSREKRLRRSFHFPLFLIRQLQIGFVSKSKIANSSSVSFSAMPRLSSAFSLLANAEGTGQARSVSIVDAIHSRDCGDAYAWVMWAHPAQH